MLYAVSAKDDSMRQRTVTSLVDQRFGRLVVLERAPNKSHGNTLWRCRCDCGAEVMVQGASLRSGRAVSCGCFAVEQRTTHGMANSLTYTTWAQMKARCLNPEHKSYANYGGRGIQVCREWLEFGQFFADMGRKPKGASLDRIDNDGHYEPGNCRWATNTQQARNRRKTRHYTMDGKTLTRGEWAARYDLSRETLIGRLNRGWPLRKALTTPPDSRKATKLKEH